MEECMSSLEAGKLVKDESYHGQSTVKEFLSSFDTVLSLSNTSYKPFLFWTFLYHILGDLKLVEKPQPIMLGPNDFSNIKVRIAATFRSNRIEWT